MSEDLETNKDFLNHIAMCLDLGLDPENPNLELEQFVDQFSDKPWLREWLQKEYDSDINMVHREKYIKRSKNQPKVTVNNIER